MPLREMRGRYINTDNGHNKWWEYEWTKGHLQTAWGKVGAKGSTNSRTMTRTEVYDLVQSKLTKGYRLVGDPLVLGTVHPSILAADSAVDDLAEPVPAAKTKPVTKARTRSAAAAVIGRNP